MDDIHELKCWPEQFAAVVSGSKKHEVRKNDRDFKVGQYLRLKEFIPGHGTSDFKWVPEEFTGATTLVRVTHITKGGTFGLPEDLCVMSIL